MEIRKENLKRMDLGLSDLDYRKLFPKGTMNVTDTEELYDRLISNDLNGAHICELLLQLSNFNDTCCQLCDDFIELDDLLCIEDIIDFVRSSLGRRKLATARYFLRTLDKAIEQHCPADLVADALNDLIEDGIYRYRHNILFKICQKIDHFYAKRLAKL